MLTKEELLELTYPPNINDISLALYREFSIEQLMGKKFIYYLMNGEQLKVEFREWGIYHMLSIQHIDNSIDSNHFFEEIGNGLDISTFKSSDVLKTRLKGEKERITLFACIYFFLRNGRFFWVPNGKVRNTQNVKMDYLLYKEIGTKGVSVGIRYEDQAYIPLTVLIARPSNKEKHLQDGQKRNISKLIIYDENEKIVEYHTYNNTKELHALRIHTSLKTPKCFRTDTYSEKLKRTKLKNRR